MYHFDVEHYLGLYTLRLKMLNNGTTHPTPEGEAVIRIVVEKLSKMPLDEKIGLKDGKMIDINGNVIVDLKNP